MLAEVKERLEDVSSKLESFSNELDPTKKSDFLDFYVRLIPRVVNAERCSVFIHDPAEKKVWLKAGTGVVERGIEVPLATSLVGEVITKREPLVTKDLDSRSGMHKTVDSSTGFVTREVLCVPIFSGDRSEVTGAIQVLNKKNGGRFSQDDQGFLEEVGQHFQGIVESIYIGQEAVRMTQEAVATASRATYMYYFWSGVSLLFLGTFGVALSLSIIQLGSKL